MPSKARRLRESLHASATKFRAACGRCWRKLYRAVRGTLRSAGFVIRSKRAPFVAWLILSAIFLATGIIIYRGLTTNFRGKYMVYQVVPYVASADPTNASATVTLLGDKPAGTTSGSW